MTVTIYHADSIAGSDITGDGLSEATAFRSIGAATSAMGFGDWVKTRRGSVFDEQVTMKRGAAQGQSSQLYSPRGWGAEGAPLAKVAPTTANRAALLHAGVDDVDIIEMELTNAGSTLNPCVSLNATNRNRLMGCKVHDSPTASDQNAISILGTGDGNEVLDSEVSFGAGDCVNVHDAQTNVLVARNYIHDAGDGDYGGGAPGDGASFHEGASGIIEDNTIERCTKGGIPNSTTSGTVIARRNFVRDCARYGIAQISTGVLQAYFNIVIMPDSAVTSGVGIGPIAGGKITLFNNTVINLSNASGMYCIGSADTSVAGTIFTAYQNCCYVVAGKNGRLAGVGRVISGANLWTVLANRNNFGGDAAGKFRWDVGAGGAAGTLAQWKTALSIDAASTGVDPQFMIPPTYLGTFPTFNSPTLLSDLLLKVGSPLLGMGVPDPAGVLGSLDIFGCDMNNGSPSTWDVGAAKGRGRESRRRKYINMGALAS